MLQKTNYIKRFEGETMKVKFMIIVLCTLTALLLLFIWLPNFNDRQPALAQGDVNQSTIAGITVEGLDSDELKQTLTEAINRWPNEPLIVSGDGSTLSLNRAAIQFDIEGTISTYESMAKKAWYEFWADDKVVHLPLQTLDSETLKNEIAKISTWNTDETYVKVMTLASYLRNDEMEAVIEDLATIETERLALAIEEVPVTAFGVYDIANALNETIIEAGSTFSFMEALGGNVNLANSETLNFVASILYHHALNMDTEIVERYAQNKVPDYLEPGVEAAIDVSANKDLKFVNRSSNPVKIKLSIDNQQLKAEAYTTYKEVDVSMKVIRDATITPRTITRYTDQLAIGKVQEVEKGEPGLRVSVYRTIQGIEQLISRDYYAPISRILLKSSRPPVMTSPKTDSDLQMDLDGDGLADVIDDESTNDTDDKVEVDESGNPVTPQGSYYDKGGNLITP